jgi:hypothetical protein
MAPIVIRMQPPGRSPSPQPIVSTRPADMTFEDGKISDTDQTASRFVSFLLNQKIENVKHFSQKDGYSELSVVNKNDDETSNPITDNNVSESELVFSLETNCNIVYKDEKFDRQTPPSQVAPVSTILSSPPTTTTTTMAAASMVPHYYPTPSHMSPHQQHLHHGIIYPQQIPPSTSSGLYPMQP